MLKKTDHDYQSCLVGNYHDSQCNHRFESWDEFKNTHAGFLPDGFDDTYHFVFRYDIHEQTDGDFELELCMMLQRKGIYTHLYIQDIDQALLDSEIYEWLKGRSKYVKSLWSEVIE